MSERLKSLGIVLAVGGLACSLVPMFDGPPAKSTLVPATVQLSDRPWVYKPGRGPRCGLLPIGAMSLRLPALDCGYSDCTFPAGIAALQPGAKMKVWRDGATVWQVQVEGAMVYSYEQARSTFNDRRLDSWLWMVGLSVAGLILAVTNWRSVEISD